MYDFAARFTITADSPEQALERKAKLENHLLNTVEHNMGVGFWLQEKAEEKSTDNQGKKRRISIYCDDLCTSPRETCDCLWRLACWHSRYTLGDEMPKEDPQEFIKNLPEGTQVRPIFMYDHSGIRISLEGFGRFDPGGWDSGQVGVAYLTPERLAKEYEKTGYDHAAQVERALETLKCEIQVYDDYLRGEVWYFEIKECTHCPACHHDEWTRIDSCHGFIGSDLDICGIKDYVGDQVTSEQLEKAWHNRGAFRRDGSFEES